jgi:hypothetical protein
VYTPFQSKRWKCGLLTIVLVLTTPHLVKASSSIVISQIYGGGGNSGATLRNDFVELFNRSSAAVSVAGWTIQYASSTGSSWDRVTSRDQSNLASIIW